jgi:hypothetical protein
MSISLLAPLGLAALAAFLLPILIHLVRRIESKTTEFAALRWIAQRVQPRRRLRFERPWLLLLRLVLLAALALLLARPVHDVATAAARARVFVAPGADLAAAHAAIASPAADWRWLAPGFPRVGDAAMPSVVPLASMLREADADLPEGATLVVAVPEQVAGLDGERPRVAHALDWHVVPGAMQERAAPVHAPETLAVRYAPDAQASITWLRAAVAAWNTREPGRYRLDVQMLDAPLADDTHWLAWLAPQLSPATRAWIERGGVVVQAGGMTMHGDPLWRDVDGSVLARSDAIGRGRLITLSGALVPATLPWLLDPGFPQRLLAALRGATTAPDRAPAAALEPVPATNTAVNPGSSGTTRPLDAWLALLIAILFLLERVVATHARARRPE